jgi:glycosyltransferase involved in cell wall biosynthesis
VCISNAVAEFHTGLVPPGLRKRASSRIQVVPDGIDVDQFSGFRQAGSDDELTEGPVVVLAYGRMARWKGYDVLIDAAGRAVSQGADLRLVIAGGAATEDDDVYLTELREAAADRDLDVEFVGPCRDVRPLLDSAHIAVLPSVRPEPFGRVVLEAMAAGLPVIATTPGGPAEVIDDRVTGRLVPGGSAEALADALSELVAQPRQRRRLGEAAARSVRDRFGTERTSMQVDEIYQELLG